jgi:hypothetical protein
MLAEALMALAATGGNAVITAMATDGWESFKGRIAKIFGGGKPELAQATAARLDQTRSALAGLNGADLERVRTEQQVVWRTRLEDLLEQHPETADQLEALVAEMKTGSTGPVQQHAVAYDQAQQAVLGHGTQIVNFGGQHGGTSQG